MLSACTAPNGAVPGPQVLTVNGSWALPDEAAPHERTWMSWPSSKSIWGPDLAATQESIVTIARAVMDREPLSILARPSQIAAVRRRLGAAATIHAAPVDDLWARDTLPLFVTSPGNADSLAASRVRFNGWGDKQTHAGDRTLSAFVAALVKIPLIDVGLTGEGGGVEGDGAGTLLANRSSWINENRNPGWSEKRVEAALLELTGATRIFWADGVKGQDITDDHIDASARFTSRTSLVTQVPPLGDVSVWATSAEKLRAILDSKLTLAGTPYTVDTITDPVSPRGRGSSFLTSYVNYYVCNGAVIIPEFGDSAADSRARGIVEAHYPGRDIVQINIDGVAAGGGGIHCATQQQPVV